MEMSLTEIEPGSVQFIFKFKISMAFMLCKLSLKLLSQWRIQNFQKGGPRLEIKKKFPYILQVDKQKKRVLVPKGGRTRLPHPWILPRSSSELPGISFN